MVGIKTENMVRVLAGSMAMVFSLLGFYVDRRFSLVPAFVGFNLAQSAFTGFCPAEAILEN